MPLCTVKYCTSNSQSFPCANRNGLAPPVQGNQQWRERVKQRSNMSSWWVVVVLWRMCERVSRRHELGLELEVTSQWNKVDFNWSWVQLWVKGYDPHVADSQVFSRQKLCLKSWMTELSMELCKTKVVNEVTSVRHLVVECSCFLWLPWYVQGHCTKGNYCTKVGQGFSSHTQFRSQCTTATRNVATQGLGERLCPVRTLEWAAALVLFISVEIFQVTVNPVTVAEKYPIASVRAYLPRWEKLGERNWTSSTSKMHIVSTNLDRRKVLKAAQWSTHLEHYTSMCVRQSMWHRHHTFCSVKCKT